jgi:hypothetical protein
MRHFVYKARAKSQITSPEPEMPYVITDERKRYKDARGRGGYRTKSSCKLLLLYTVLYTQNDWQRRIVRWIGRLPAIQELSSYYLAFVPAPVAPHRLMRMYGKTRHLLHDEPLPSTVLWIAEQHECLLAWVGAPQWVKRNVAHSDTDRSWHPSQSLFDTAF